MPDIQEAKCYEFTVRILPPLGAPRGGQKKFLRFAQTLPTPPTFISVYALVYNDSFKRFSFVVSLQK